MADCHFRHECEEFGDYNGELACLNKFQGCTKNPGHERFIPVGDLKMGDVPLAYQTDKWMRDIQYHCNRTVKIHLSYTSEHRPDTWYGSDHPYPYSYCKGSDRIARCGTGYIFFKYVYKDRPCPCKECKKSGRPVIGYMKVEVWTARHVVYDESEAIQMKVECFYDTPDGTGIKVLYGADSFLDNYDRPDSDKLRVNCYTHDKDVMDKLNKMIIKPEVPWIDDKSVFFSGLTVSHPHGVHKHISFGHPRFYICSIGKDHYPKHPGFVKCRLKRPHCCTHSPLKKKKKISQYQNKRKDDVKGIKMYLENVTCPSMVEPGILYLLPNTSKICLPYDRGLPLDWQNGDVGWYDIPEGVGYTDSNGKLVLFPPGMEIWCQFDFYSAASIYDIPTCPGCSGALVFIHKGGFIIYDAYVHSGADKVLGNKGSLGFSYP